MFKHVKIYSIKKKPEYFFLYEKKNWKKNLTNPLHLLKHIVLADITRFWVLMCIKFIFMVTKMTFQWA